MSKKTEHIRQLLELADYKPKIAIEYGQKKDNVDVGYNLAKQIEEINRKAYKDYLSQELRKAELEEVQEIARKAVLDTIADLKLDVSINGDILTERIADVITNGISGGSGK